MPFAEGTVVPPEKSRAEIERLVSKYGATRFASGWELDSQARIEFVAQGRHVRFVLKLPTVEDGKKALKGRRGTPWNGPTEAQVTKWRDDETRRRWRCLLLAIKAKLEVVETGIETFEQAFLANIVTDNGQTVAQRILHPTGRLALPAVASEPVPVDVEVVPRG